MAKVNPTLYRLIGEDLAKVDPAFKQIDMTRPDVAAAVLLKLTSVPQVMQSLTDRNPRTVLMFNAIKAVAHEGASVGYHRSGVPMEPIENNRFGDRDPESMAGLLQWAESDPDWTAIRNDPSHPEYAEVRAQYSEILDVIHRPLPSVDADGAHPALALEAELQAAMADPAYLDRLSVGHEAAVDRVAMIHARKWPGADQADAPRQAVASVVQPVAVPVSPMVRVAELQADPSFLDRGHPAHDATIAAISAEYERAYPQAPEPVDTVPAALPAFIGADDPRLADIQARMAQAIRRPDLPAMTPLAKAEHLSRLPAYNDAADPGHVAAVHEVQSAYAAAFPEPASASDGGAE